MNGKEPREVGGKKQKKAEGRKQTGSAAVCRTLTKSRINRFEGRKEGRQ